MRGMDIARHLKGRKFALKRRRYWEAAHPVLTYGI